MLVAQFAQYLRIGSEEVEQLLSLQADMIYDDPLYKDLVQAIDTHELERSAHIVRALYEEHLNAIKTEFGLGDTVMSGYTLVNWTLGFIVYPDRMRDMLPVHAAVSPELVAKMLPHLLELLDQLEENGDVWKRALLTFSLPLVAMR